MSLLHMVALNYLQLKLEMDFDVFMNIVAIEVCLCIINLLVIWSLS